MAIAKDHRFPNIYAPIFVELSSSRLLIAGDFGPITCMWFYGHQGVVSAVAWPRRLWRRALARSRFECLCHCETLAGFAGDWGSEENQLLCCNNLVLPWVPLLIMESKMCFFLLKGWTSTHTMVFSWVGKPVFLQFWGPGFLVVCPSPQKTFLEGSAGFAALVWRLELWGGCHQSLGPKIFHGKKKSQGLS